MLLTSAKILHASQLQLLGKDKNIRYFKNDWIEIKFSKKHF